MAVQLPCVLLLGFLLAGCHGAKHHHHDHKHDDAVTPSPTTPDTEAPDTSLGVTSYDQYDVDTNVTPDDMLWPDEHSTVQNNTSAQMESDLNADTGDYETQNLAEPTTPRLPTNMSNSRNLTSDISQSLDPLLSPGYADTNSPEHILDTGGNFSDDATVDSANNLVINATDYDLYEAPVDSTSNLMPYNDTRDNFPNETTVISITNNSLTYEGTNEDLSSEIIRTSTTLSPSGGASVLDLSNTTDAGAGDDISDIQEVANNTNIPDYIAGNLSRVNITDAEESDEFSDEQETEGSVIDTLRENTTTGDYIPTTVSPSIQLNTTVLYALLNETTDYDYIDRLETVANEEYTTTIPIAILPSEKNTTASTLNDLSSSSQENMASQNYTIMSTQALTSSTKPTEESFSTPSPSMTSEDAAMVTHETEGFTDITTDMEQWASYNPITEVDGEPSTSAADITSVNELTTVTMVTSLEITSHEEANTTVSSDHVQILHWEQTSGTFAGLVLASVFGCLFLATMLVLVGKRCYESYKRRHYTKVDYLVNGMYT